MFKGIVELESLTKIDVIKKMKTVKSYEERHPEAKIKLWHVYKVEIAKDEIGAIVKRISDVIKTDWFSIFWNDNSVLVVFLNKIYQLSRKQVEMGDYEEVKNFAARRGIQEIHFNLQKEIDSW